MSKTVLCTAINRDGVKLKRHNKLHSECPIVAFLVWN